MRDFEAKKQGVEEQSLLRQLVKKAGLLLKATNLKSTLSGLSGSLLDPSIRDALIDELSKIAHYWVISQFLYEQAKKLDILRHVDIEEVHLSQDQFHKPDLRDYTPSLGATEMRIGIVENKQNAFLSVYRGRKMTEEQQSVRFAKTVRRTLKSGKVHAEMQILAHYQLTQVLMPPRVVASSKSACFLCNTMLDIQGRYTTPHTHGRLYSGWILPRCVLSDPEGLSQSLDCEIQGRIKGLIEQAQLSGRRLYPEPNESTVHKLSLSLASLGGSLKSLISSVITNSLSARGSSTSTITPRHFDSSQGVHSTGSASSTGTSSHSPTECSPPHVILHGSSVEAAPRGYLSRENTDVSASRSASRSLLETETSQSCSGEVREFVRPLNLRLDRGTSCSVSLRPDQGTIVVQADLLTVFLDWPAKRAADTSATTEVEFTLEWLSEAQRSESSAQGILEVDVHSLSANDDMVCSNSKVIVLRVGGEAVRMTR
jgi:hypothetical protein